VASWLIFYVTHSLRIDSDMLVVTASPARTALKISQLTDGGMPPIYDSMHYAKAHKGIGLNRIEFEERAVGLT